VTRLANASSRRTIGVATSGSSGCWLLERGGIITTMHSHVPPSMAYTGGSSICPATSYGRLNTSASPVTSTAPHLPYEPALLRVVRMQHPGLRHLGLAIKCRRTE